LFKIRFSAKAERFLIKCEKKIKERFRKLFLVLEFTPLPVRLFDLRKVAGEEDSYRIRVSKYRVLYHIYWEEKLIRVIKIERRKGRTYKKL